MAVRVLERIILQFLADQPYEVFGQGLPMKRILKETNIVPESGKKILEKLWKRGWLDSSIGSHDHYYQITGEGRRALRGELVTPAQLELLRWLVGHNHVTGISGGSLVDYYYQKWLDRHSDYSLGRSVLSVGGPTTPRAHGWRRAGGTALAKLAEWGLADEVETKWGVPQYELTDAGIRHGESKDT